MARELVVHIGTGKTGTTSIQNVLARRRGPLSEAGILYPKCLGPTNHEAAAVAVADFHPGFSTAKAPAVKSANDLPAFRAALRAQLEEEHAERDYQKIIVSNEHLYEKVRATRHALLFKELFEGLYSRITIVVYLREQTDFASAIYAELVRMGSVPNPDSFLQQKRTADLLDFAGGIQSWASVFGRENVIPRVFDRSMLIGGDTLEDFLVCADVKKSVLKLGPDLESVLNSRVTLDATKTEFLRRFNQSVHNYFKDRNEQEKVNEFKRLPSRSVIVKGLERLPVAGPRFRLPERVCSAIRERYEGDTLTLFAEYGIKGFPSKERKPGDDMEAVSFSEAQCMEMFSSIWAETQTKHIASK